MNKLCEAVMVKEFFIPKETQKSFSEIIATSQENIGNHLFQPILLEKIIIQDNPRQLHITTKDIIQGISESDEKKLEKHNELKELRNLSDSIKKNGVMQPIHVYSNKEYFYLIMGQRRTLAALLAGKKTIPSKVWKNKPTDIEIKTFQWLENFHRKDLSAADTLFNVQQLSIHYEKQNNKSITVTTLASYLSCSKAQAVKYHALLNAHGNVIEALNSGKLNSISKAYQVNKISDENQRKSMIDNLFQGKITQAELSTADIFDTKKNIKKNPRKRGRKSKKITMGCTKNINVIKEILSLITQKKRYHSLKNEFSKINWENNNDISEKFKMFIDFMEKENEENK